jgi:gas vesicle protein
MAISSLTKGVVLGVAVAVAVPLLLRSSRGQAVGKAVLRTGELLAEKAADFAAEIGEIAEDTLAEWQQAELEADTGESANEDHPPPPGDQQQTA